MYLRTPITVYYYGLICAPAPSFEWLSLSLGELLLGVNCLVSCSENIVFRDVDWYISSSCVLGEMELLYIKYFQFQELSNKSLPER
jgi:hypothetical protein